MADSAAQKKPGFIQRAKRFFKDVSGEMKKVVWPTKEQTRNNTVIVLVVVAISAAVVGCFDFVVSQLIQQLAKFL